MPVPTSLLRIARMLARAGVVLLAALAIGIAGVVGYEYAAARRSDAEEASLLVHGKDVFSRNCVLCHGANLAGHVPGAPLDAPPLKKFGFAFWYSAMPKDMEKFIAGLAGSGRGKMPPFQAILPPEDLASVAFYIRQVNRGRAGGPKEAASGTP